jgi:hypothetical protein
MTEDRDVLLSVPAAVRHQMEQVVREDRIKKWTDSITGLEPRHEKRRGETSEEWMSKYRSKLPTFLDIDLLVQRKADDLKSLGWTRKEREDGIIIVLRSLQSKVFPQKKPNFNPVKYSAMKTLLKLSGKSLRLISRKVQSRKDAEIVAAREGKEYTRETRFRCRNWKLIETKKRITVAKYVGCASRPHMARLARITSLLITESRLVLGDAPQRRG